MSFFANIPVADLDRSNAFYSGLGWKTEAMANAAELTQPTICKMKRPAS